MLKKLATIICAAAFGLAVYAPDATACPGSDMETKTAEKEKKKDDKKVAKKDKKSKDKAKNKSKAKKKDKAKKGKKVTRR